MAVTNINVFSDVYAIFYNLINTQVTDPSNRNKQWLFSSFPEEDLANDKLTFPIIIIEPADGGTLERVTQTKTRIPLVIRINVYSARMVQADSLLCNVNAVIDNNRINLKYTEGLDFVILEGTDTDFDIRGGTRAHVRSATYSMQFIYKDGLSKGTNAKTINSSGEII